MSVEHSSGPHNSGCDEPVHVLVSVNISGDQPPVGIDVRILPHGAHADYAADHAQSMIYASPEPLDQEEAERLRKRLLQENIHANSTEFVRTKVMQVVNPLPGSSKKSRSTLS
jgi:hypothetical protein